MDAGKVRRLFVSALELDPSQRAALLAGESVSEAERQAVLELLAFDPGRATKAPRQRDPTTRLPARLRLFGAKR